MHFSQDGDILSEIFDRIFALQFKNLKCGDPYFYSNSLKKGEVKLNPKLVRLFSTFNDFRST